MTRLARTLLRTMVPRWTSALSSAVSRAHSQALVKEQGLDRLNHKLVQHLGNAVQDGPFAGLLLSPMTLSQHIGPFLLGTYESELHPAWDIVFRRTYPQIIDIGASFGYYAVGLARRYPGATVVAFDTDRWARKAVREMAAANGVANCQVRSFCSPGELNRRLLEGALVISDCEGYEEVLFGRDMSPRLRSATLIIESHENRVPGILARLTTALAVSHTVLCVKTGEGLRAPSSDLGFLSDRERALSTDEFRPEQAWLVCWPKGH